MRQVLDTVKKHHVYIEVLTAKYYNHYIKDSSLKSWDQNVFGITSPLYLLGIHLMEYRFGIRRVKNLDQFYKSDEQIYQIAAMGEKSETEAVRQDILAFNNPNILLREVWERILYISGQKVSKSEGMMMLCERFGIDPRDVVAIGDDMNDIDMIKAAGMGVAMGNARDEVKAVADFITKSNNENGAALALEKFF
jgi:hydroxymethylpyrimidine pyrophosphatase-like HAD family hydrolase